MYCKNCGKVLPDNALFCSNCGAKTVSDKEDTTSGWQQNGAVQTGAGVGFSSRINDPAFAKYIKNTNSWAAIFSIIIAVIAVVGFFIAGEAGVEDMENPQSLFIGLAIGAMFLLIAFFQILKRKRSRTWDGTVIDKTVKKKSRQRQSGDDYYTEYYTEYVVLIRDNSGKEHRIRVEDDDTVFNYYQIGDRVRHHAGLNSYEKYDKSRDNVIFCSACSTLCDINEDFCPRCKCPLLK